MTCAGMSTADHVGAPISFLDCAFRCRLAKRIIGVVSLESDQPAAFDENDQRLLSILGGHLAAVIENARLMEGLEAEVVARTAEVVAEKEKSETILRSVGDAICMTDEQMQVRYVNPAFTSLTGYTAQQITGQSLDRLLAETCPEPDRVSWQRALRNGESWQGELVLQRKDGRTYEAASTLAPLSGAGERLAGTVFGHQDISRLKDLDRARSQFMANVSHELRTPASIMKLCTQRLRQERGAEETGRISRLLEGQVNRLLHLIQDILEMAELDSGRMNMAWKPILAVYAHAGTQMVRYHDQATGAGLTLLRSVAPELPIAEGSQGRLFQALGELMENAIIFTPAGGQVTVEAGLTEEEGQRWVTVAVHDTGPGISLQEQGRVFDRLYRGRLAESGHIPGTGLGLSIAQEIMRAHGGRVTVESEPGKGSTFTLWLRGAG